MRIPQLHFRSRRSWLTLVGLIVLGVMAVLPWWRNHTHLRDFYDYGLVISGVGRISAGERPYTDFTTPIQSGLFLFNRAAESLAGGTFQGMSGGAAWLSLLAAMGFAWLLGRRWPLPAAMAVSAAIVFGSAAQHTLIWHNSVGVICLALAVWGAALAPVLQRSALAWHAIVFAGLFLGGLNKINFHLIALAFACGWTLRAGLLGHAPWWRVLSTIGVWLLAGFILPVASELAWTGAPFPTWWYNVIELPLASRAGGLAEVFTGDFYLRPLHDYYGPLLLPQVGLVGLMLLLVAGGACVWKSAERRGLDRALIAIAVLMAAGGFVGLLATNHEIGYLALAAALVLAAGLWLGFGVPPDGARFWAGLVAPAVVIGIVAWWAAWQGQRSQFGHSVMARDTYLPAETAGAAYAYLEGTQLPPELHASLAQLATFMPDPDETGMRAVFYGPGMEWLERIFPARKHRGLPLWVHWGTSYGPREVAQLQQLVGPRRAFGLVLNSLAWNHWHPGIQATLDHLFATDLVGPVIQRRQLTTRTALFPNAIDYLNTYGGNVAAIALVSDLDPVEPQQDASGQLFLGVTRGTGRLSLQAPVYNLEGEVRVRRLSPSADAPAHADFRVVTREGQFSRWSARIELPAGEAEVTARFTADSDQMELDFVVQIPPEFSDRIAAGFRGPRITRTGPNPGSPPRVRPGGLPDDITDPAVSAAVFPGDWQPDEIVVRGGHVTAAGLEISSGGELWFRGSPSTLEGELRVAPAGESAGLPVARIVWSKGARFEIFTQAGLRPEDRRLDFRAWSPEPDGWFGILIDAIPGRPPVLVRISRAESSP